MSVLPYKGNGLDKKSQMMLMFDNIAAKYDLLNHLLSLNTDKYWRRKAIDHLKNDRPETILDIATGTGDMAIAAMRLNPALVTGIDISGEMIRIGNEKLKKRNLNGRIVLLQGDGENLPFGNESFDAVMSGFGVRNFENLRRGMHEAHRVLKRGGRLVILEFSKPQGSLAGRLFRFYFKHLLPKAGGGISGDYSAYSYLPESVDKFPDGVGFLSVIKGDGFDECQFKRLTLGIATIYSGVKRRDPV